MGWPPSISLPLDRCLCRIDSRGQVFTSTSTMIFRTFPCDYAVVNGKGYLMADYSVECDTLKHTIFRVYAVFMMLVRRETPFTSRPFSPLPPEMSRRAWYIGR